MQVNSNQHGMMSYNSVMRISVDLILDGLLLHSLKHQMLKPYLAMKLINSTVNKSISKSANSGEEGVYFETNSDTPAVEHESFCDTAARLFLLHSSQ